MEASQQECVQETPQQQYLEVQAPTDLREGYILWVNTENGCFPVQVPSGGVLGGQTVPMAIVQQVIETDEDSPTKESTGHWSHGLCSCFRRGLCHPHAWSVCLCPEIFLPQLLRKLKLDWAGSTSPVKSKSTTLRNGLFVLVVLSYMATWFLRAPSSVTSSSRNATNDQWNLSRSEILLWEIAYVLLTLPAAIYGLTVTIRLRSAIRANANIPTGCLGRMEDCCCVFMCYGCTVSQMAGQVLEGDDEAALAKCKNVTGGACGTTSIGTDEEEPAV